MRLDEIADAADVARGTLYSHFASKDELIQAIVTPALEAAVAGLKKLSKGSARKRMDELFLLYLRLWDEHRDALRLSYRLQDVSLGPAGPLHSAFRQGVVQLLTYACRTGTLRIKDPVIASRMIMRVSVPLLEVCVHGSDGNDLFLQSMRGLLMVDPKPPKPQKSLPSKPTAQRHVAKERVSS